MVKLSVSKTELLGSNPSAPASNIRNNHQHTVEGPKRHGKSNRGSKS